MSTNQCCSKCNKFLKYPGADFCCRTCRDTNGQSHGRGCQQKLCQQIPQIQQIPQSSQIQQLTNCNNLKTGGPLYDPTKTICFYNFREPYEEFTNFYPAILTINGKTYPTSEHYFQSQKFTNNPQIAEQIRISNSPRDAFNIARQNSQYVDANWRSNNINVMETALKAKFTQHPILRNILINTGNKTLVEHTVIDNFWGDGGDGSGQNNLGEALMRIRELISKGQLGGDPYYSKYLKYKQKYLKLKNKKL